MERRRVDMPPQWNQQKLPKLYSSTNPVHTFKTIAIFKKNILKLIKNKLKITFENRQPLRRGKYP